ncbi:MAG: flagellar basal-body MS-ring/collar protein FliF [Gemmatimonadales bacterium]
MTNVLPPAMLDSVRRMNGSNKFLTLASLVVGIGLIWAITHWGGQPEMETLYRGLELREAGAMTDALTKAGVRYQLSGGGSEILVPNGDLARARVLLAKSGLPSQGGVQGNEMLDKPMWGVPEAQMRSMERRALEGELSRTIGEMDGVDRAVVHLGLPESSPLRKLDRPAKASVMLTLRSGRVLSPEAVQSITYLVASSVPQLNSDQVAILDSEMRLLNAPNDGSTRGLTSRQLEMQRSVEEYLARNAERILATSLGAGEARVQVSAKLNFEQVDKTVETYNPDGAVLQNEQRSETAGADSLDGGTATIVNNTYLNSRVVEKVAGSIGGIERLTVAVLINEKALQRAASAGTTAAQALPRYEQLVRDAIGIDSARGDRLTATALPFEAVMAGPDSLADEGSGTVQVLVVAERFSRPMLGLVGIIAALILALRVLKPQRDAGGRASGTGENSGGGSLPSSGDRELDLPPVRVPELSSSTTRLKSEVQSESSQRPEVAASVVKAWLSADG